MTSRLTHQGLGNELLVYSTSLDPRPHFIREVLFRGGQLVKEAKYIHILHMTQDTLNTIKSLQASGLSFSTHNVYLTTTQTLSHSYKVSIV